MTFSHRVDGFSDFSVSFFSCHTVCFPGLGLRCSDPLLVDLSTYMASLRAQTIIQGYTHTVYIKSVVLLKHLLVYIVWGCFPNKQPCDEDLCRSGLLGSVLRKHCKDSWEVDIEERNSNKDTQQTSVQGGNFICLAGETPETIQVISQNYPHQIEENWSTARRFKVEVLHLDTTDIWGIVLCPLLWGSVLHIVGWSAASLASACQMPVTSQSPPLPSGDNQKYLQTFNSWRPKFPQLTTSGLRVAPRDV